MALLLMRRGKAGDATVTVAHSRSRDLAAITRAADIVIAAIGRAHFLGADHIGDNAVVIDVGLTGWKIQLAQGLSHRRRRRLRCCGGAMRRNYPGPGRSWPMTIAMLLSNTTPACERSAGRVGEVTPEGSTLRIELATKIRARRGAVDAA